jgi:hypothetical protein
MADEQEQGNTAEQDNETVKEPEQSPGTKSTEKTLTQSEVNKILADERRKHEAQFKALKGEFDAFRGEIEAREKAANDAAAEKVEALRKDLPESITKLLDKLTPIEQLEWLNDPENIVTKKQIPELPTSAEGHGKQRKQINIV